MIQHDDIHATETVALYELLVKISPVLAMKNIEEIEVCLHTFFTMALTGSEWLTARTCRFNRGNIPIKWEAWWAPEQAWTFLEKRTIPCPYRDLKSGLSIQ
jgi:hypothetical protein